MKKAYFQYYETFEIVIEKIKDIEEREWLRKVIIQYGLHGIEPESFNSEALEIAWTVCKDLIDQQHHRREVNAANRAGKKAEPATNKENLAAEPQPEEKPAQEIQQEKIAEAKAAQEVQKMTEVTMAEKEKAVAILNAEREKEVARLNALKAIEDAKRIKAEGEAEAAANRAKVAAGLTPQESKEWEYKTRVGIAEALAKSSQPLVPEIMMIGGNKDNGSANSAMDAIGLNMMMDLTDRIAKNK